MSYRSRSTREAAHLASVLLPLRACNATSTFKDLTAGDKDSQLGALYVDLAVLPQDTEYDAIRAGVFEGADVCLHHPQLGVGV